MGQSNKKLVRNALEHCFKARPSTCCSHSSLCRATPTNSSALKCFDDMEHERFIILFRSIHTGRHDLRALYGFVEGSWQRVYQLLPSPVSLHERMVTQCLRYDSGGKARG